MQFVQAGRSLRALLRKAAQGLLATVGEGVFDAAWALCLPQAAAVADQMAPIWYEPAPTAQERAGDEAKARAIGELLLPRGSHARRCECEIWNGFSRHFASWIADPGLDQRRRR